MAKITERSVIGMFYERLKLESTLWVDAISTNPMDSDQDSEDYAWLGQTPQMTEKKGEKKFDQLSETPWTVKNVPYQGGIRIPLNHVLYDKTGQILVRVNEQADRARNHWNTLVAPLIISGESTVCYDGQYFFDTDHSEGDSGSQSNDITHVVTTPANPTATESIDAILAAIETMVGFKDDKGEYVNEDMSEFLVVSGLPLMSNLMKALSQSQVGGGDTNVLLEQDNYRIRLKASPRFSSWTTKFSVFSTEGNQKPIIRQQRTPNNGASGFDVGGMRLNTIWVDSEYCKLNDECLVSIETERAAAYGDWKKATLVTLTT